MCDRVIQMSWIEWYRILCKKVRYKIFSTFMASKLLLVSNFTVSFYTKFYTILFTLFTWLYNTWFCFKGCIIYWVTFILLHQPWNCHCDITDMQQKQWKNKWLAYPHTHDAGTSFAGVWILQPIPQPQWNPSIYPGVFPYPCHSLGKTLRDV